MTARSGRAASYARPDRTATAAVRDTVIATCLLGVHVALVWLARAPAILTRQDDARYLGLARALRVGQYRDLMWPGAPVHHMYPPGYPALLALWTAVGGEGFDWLVALNVVLSVATLALTYVAMRRVSSAVVAVGTLLLLAVSPHTIEWTGQIASEGALAICFAAVLWGATLPEGGRRTTVLAVAALLAPFMRTAGIVLPIAVTLDWALARRWRAAALMGVATVAVVGGVMAWTLSDPVTAVGSSYAADLVSTRGRGGMVGELFGRLRANATYYPMRGLPWMLTAPTIAGTALDNVAASAVIVVGIVAGLLWSATRLRVVALALLGTFGLLLIWPYQVDRYLLPVLPVLVPTLLAGVAWLAGRLSPTAARVATAAVVIICGATSVSRDAPIVARAQGCPRGTALPADSCLTADQASFFDAVVYVRDSLPRDARVLSAKSEPLNHYTGRVTVPLTQLVWLDSTRFWDTMRRDDADYVLLGALQFLERRRLAPRLRERCADLGVVASFPPHTLLLTTTPQATPQGTTSASPEACAAIDRYLDETTDLR